MLEVLGEAAVTALVVVVVQVDHCGLNSEVLEGEWMQVGELEYQPLLDHHVVAVDPVEDLAGHPQAHSVDWEDPGIDPWVGSLVHGPRVAVEGPCQGGLVVEEGPGSCGFGVHRDAEAAPPPSCEGRPSAAPSAWPWPVAADAVHAVRISAAAEAVLSGVAGFDRSAADPQG